ncbi:MULTISPECIES: bifunctional glutamate N-acetyltransferase/amino-acid acetyltransferase ArgJ [unclassified Luteococcus]|uniref:bifunctional glutamate N-acetyltransferase/amino-acid acetyltransferase ArgJ n=1 Tax=unclassified Luteococcus TaxID=2639923 RepID=UPI00313DC4FD
MDDFTPDRSGSVTTPKGFTAAGLAAGIKESGKPDLALVVNNGPLQDAAAVFTSNRIFAAPVQWSRDVTSDGVLKAVVLNSGGANACTGKEGLADSVKTAVRVAAGLDCVVTDVAVCSTGLIGVRLPMGQLLSGVDQAVARLSAQGGPDAAAAIMTTDTVRKMASYTSPDGWSIGGMAKGAGMLAPALATMLVVLTTDADVKPLALDKALRQATSVSFDRVDSDGCQSTNDSVVLMSSGASGFAPLPDEFTTALSAVCLDLAMQLLADAEGSAHDIAITVKNAATEADALEVARSIARNNLFKCAIFGNDPNWGRVLAAAGTTGAAFEVENLDVWFNGVQVYRQGGIGEDRSLVDLSGRQVDVVVNLNHGKQQATVWTNDLTYDYVKENAEYSS